MQSKKEQRAKLFQVNKMHKKQQRKLHIKKEEQKEINVIKNMSHEQLLNFLETKYDKFIQYHEDQEHKANYLIAATIQARTKQFQKQLMNLYVNFLVKNGGKQLNDEQYKEVMQRRRLCLPKDVQLRWTNQQGIQVMNIVTNYSSGQKRSGVNKFVCQPLPQNLRIQIDMKRAKKECVSFLQNIIKYKNIVYGIVY